MRAIHSHQEIDLSSWKRARHYALFGGNDYPFIGITTEIDITAWDLDRRRKGRRFFSAFLHRVMTAINGLENFRYRIDGDRVVLFERVDPNFVVFDPIDELPYFAVAPMDDDFARFDESVEAATQIALKNRNLGDDRLDFVYLSCLPWFGFTDIIQPMGLASPDSIPRIMWGQRREKGESVVIDFSITGHHGLFDGFHIAKLLEAITEIGD